MHKQSIRVFLFLTFILGTFSLHAYNQHTTTSKASECDLSNQTMMSVNFLYYQAINHGYMFAQDGLYNPFPNFDEEYMNFITKEVEHNYHPGIKLLICHSWKDFRLFFDYSYLHASDHKKCITKKYDDNLEGLRPIFEFQGFGNYKFANAFYRLNFNTADLYMDYPYSPSKHFNLYPFLGFKFATLYQRFYNKFWNIPEEDPISFIPWIVDFKSHNNYWGLGLTLGANGTYLITKEFHLTTTFSTALLYGKRMVKSKAHQSFVAFPGHLPGDKSLLLEEVAHDQYSMHQFVPAILLNAGFEYEHTFKNCISLKTALSWDFNYWCNQYFQSLLDASRFIIEDKPLEMQGLNLQMQISF